MLDMYRQRMTTMLKLPCETRFCTNFYTVESLLRNKNAVMETFVCAPFFEWEGEQPEWTKQKVRDLKIWIDDRHFWDDIGNTYLVMMPVMLALRQLDQKMPNLGKVWMAWWTVQMSLESPEEPSQCLVKPWKAPFNASKRAILAKYVHARWVGAHSPLHSVAFLLDPEYWNMDINEVDEEVIEDFYHVVNHFFEDADDHANAVSELTKFKLKEGMFSLEIVQKMATNQAAWKWWLTNGGSAPTLRRLAVRILAQCSSNSGSERNWSTYNYVHSTIRNRLLSSRAEKLVYMYCNHRLIDKISSKDYKEDVPQWTIDVNPEDDIFEELPEEEAAPSCEQSCTLQEIEDNLAIDYSLERSHARRLL